MLNSFEELCITQEAAVNSFDRVLNPTPGGCREHILIGLTISSNNCNSNINCDDNS